MLPYAAERGRARSLDAKALKSPDLESNQRLQCSTYIYVYVYMCVYIYVYMHLYTPRNQTGTSCGPLGRCFKEEFPNMGTNFCEDGIYKAWDPHSSTKQEASATCGSSPQS